MNTHTPVRCVLWWKTGKVLLRHAVGLLGLHQAGPVRFQDSEGGVVLEGCDHAGAEALLLVQEPNSRRDAHDSHHAENDQGGQQRTGP